MKNKLSFLLFLIAFNSIASEPNTIHGYNLENPDKKIILPEVLNEVSGVTWIDQNTIACIQDEKGILFIYDLAENKISNQFTFNIDGDYEGITRVNNSIFVLRSDGTLFEISDYNLPTSKLKTYLTGIPANNNEGLCYDADNNRLLIAAKSNPGKGHEFKDKRFIYGFDLKTKKLDPQVVFSFDLTEIKEFAVDKNAGIPTNDKKQGKLKEPFIRFRASAIDIHPLTKKLFLLSATDHILFIFDSKGNVEHIETLDPTLFNKAEGITFYKNGDMIITNEAQDKKPTLLKFNYRE